MKRRPVFALLGVAMMFAGATSCRCSGDQPPTEAPTKPTLSKQSFRLDNGLEADLASGACGDSVALVVLVPSGLNHDPPGRSGLAQLAGRILAASASEGRAERSVQTGSDFTVYSVVVPGDRLLDELEDIATWMKTVPTEADLGRERASLLADIAALNGADASATAVRLADEALDPARGEGKRLGIASEVEAITLEELQTFWRAHFAPGAARIHVAGRFEPDPVRARVEGAFSRLPAGTQPALREPTNATVKGTLVMGEAPSAVGIAVPAPSTTDALFGPFLVLAARLSSEDAAGQTWDATYAPLTRPELLFISGPVGPAEQPEPAAARIRAEVAALLTEPLSPDDVKKARSAFQLFIDPELLDPELCAKDARAFAIARARRAQLKLEGSALLKGIEATTQAQLEEAASLFDAKHSAAVIAGGAIR